MRIFGAGILGASAASLVLGAAGCMRSVRSEDAQVVPARAPALPATPQAAKPSKPAPARRGPSGPIRSDYAAGEITRLCAAAMEDARRRLDAIGALAPDARTVDNTILAFEGTLAEAVDAVFPLTFMSYVSKKEKVAAEGAQCEERFNQFNVSVFTRTDLHEAIKDASGRNAQERRLISEAVRAFELNGLKLPAGKLQRVKELKTRLASLEARFQANLNKDSTTVEFAPGELAGVSRDFIARLKKTADGKLVVTTKSTDYVQVMENATWGETRRKMLSAYFSRAGDPNTALLEEAILLRRRVADEMGFATWADYRIQGRMAKDGKDVLSFLGGLKDKLAKRAREDLDKLLAFKRETDPSAARVEMWDISYLAYQLKKRDYRLDDDRIREFFPADVVIAGMFEVYSKLLGVRFVEVKGAPVWSPDVKLYRIEGAAAGGGPGALIAYFYADFFPRQGKYGHAAAFPLVAGRMLGDGSYSVPVAAIVANMNPPSGGKPSLLNHAEVVTTFHEFGHIMHQTLTRAPYASLSGSGTAQDFVEAPSQMLENWVWDPGILGKVSGHYRDHSRKLPPDVLAKLIEARDFNQGYFYTRQLLLGLLDMTYHTSRGPVDTAATHDRLYREIIGVEPLPGGRFPAGFGHLMGGYDAGYYGYLWSEVYAADMFTRFEASGLLDPETGTSYRRHILEPGNMTDARELLERFLGRAPSNEAFLRKLKIVN